jgi:tetratricopeptide (TPR) repeat protein
VLYDTILSQLRDDEQDVIIGHELGHVANRSIWVYSAVYPMTMTAMIVLSFHGGGFFGVLAGAALRAGAFRLMSRRFEYDCDRRAALATSPDAIARGLRRIYAGHVLGKPGLLTDIVHSTATHPSLNERIQALDELASSGVAGDNQSVTVSYDVTRAAFCRKLVAVSAVLLFCLTAYGITAPLIGRNLFWPMLALCAAVFGPTFFMTLAIWRPIRIEAVRNKAKVKWTNLTFRQKNGVISCAGVYVAALCLFVFVHESFVPKSPEYAIIGAVALLAMLLALLGGIIFGFAGSSPNRDSRKKLKIRRRITGAVQRNDFDQVIEICKENYDVVKHDKQLKYSGAAALLATRQLEKFVPYCEQIREEFPHFPPPAIALATVYLDQDESEKAPEALRGIEKDLHKLDPLPATMSSRALLALGQLDEARTQCNRGSELAPDDVSTMAQAARVEMTAGDLEEADRLIEQGNDLLPAEPLLIVARGERAILNGDLFSLHTERDALAAALKGDRLLCLYSPLARFDEVPGTLSSDDV